MARAEGNPGKRRLNDCEPQPRATTPRCPDHLDAEAKKQWKHLVRVLRRMKVLTEADGMTLANLCQAWSTLMKAQTKLTEMGILYKTPNGHIQQESVIFDGESVHRHGHENVQGVWANAGRAIADRSADGNRTRR